MISAVVIDAAREKELRVWLRDLVGSLRKYNASTLHFKHCDTENGRLACATIADLPLRCFVVASNKKNMRRYFNPFAAKIPAQNWFYCWLTRLLL